MSSEASLNYIVSTFVADEFHPIPIGDTVTVFRLPTATPPYIEGRAIVRRLAPGQHSYFVQFADDPLLRERLIRLELQQNPENLLAALIDLWRAEQMLSAAFAIFFPSDRP